MDSVLVLTGVSSAQDTLAAPPHRRPTFIAADLTGLFTVDTSTGGWRVRREDSGLELTGDGSPVEALRALCAQAWDGGWPATISAGDTRAEEALRVLRLTG